MELRRGKEYHIGAICLNAGRHALEFIITANNYTKIFLPYYSCKVLLEPIERLGIEYEFYFIDTRFEAVFDFDKIKPHEAFLYINYFGLKSGYVKSITSKCPNLIIDNAQSFFELPLPGVDTFYSPRKFFGVPDGAYLYCQNSINIEINETTSFQRFDQLLRRIDQSAEEGYPYFVANENSLSHLSSGKMSELTKNLLQSIDYDNISLIRRRNYEYLHRVLGSQNRLQIDLNPVKVPMVYPFLNGDLSLRKKLIDHRIYTAQYWPNVLDWCEKKSVEYNFANELISLPVDQRLEVKDLDKIIKIASE